MKDRTTQLELRKYYAEILAGRSICESKKHGPIHAKHLGVWDTQDIDIHRDRHFKEAVKKGLPTNEEKTKLLSDQELWDPEKDKKLKEQERFVTRMNETKSKLILKSEIAGIKDKIEEAEEETVTEAISSTP